MHLCIFYTSSAGYSFTCSLNCKIRWVAFQSPSEKSLLIGQELSYNKHTLPMTSSGLINIVRFYACLIVMKKLIWVSLFEVLYSWNESFFSKALKSRKKVGGGHFVDQASFVPPTLMRTAGFVRQEEWLELFLFCLFPVFIFIIFSTLTVAWYFKQLEAHRKFHSKQNPIC